MLIARLGMTGYSENYLLGKRLFGALKGDASLAGDCFCQRASPGCFGADRDTTPALHWYSGVALPVLLYYTIHRLCDKVDEACIFITVPGQSTDSGDGSIKQQ